MQRWPWTERTFHFDYPPEKMPELLERLRGTPPRAEEMVAGLGEDVLTWHDGKGWSIKQNIGHLIDTEFLPLQRIKQIVAGERMLVAADMSNRQTTEANHDATAITQLLTRLRAERNRLVEKVARLAPDQWQRSGIHPRLEQPMRIVDIVYFTSEHDDYHLARIRQIMERWSVS